MTRRKLLGVLPAGAMGLGARTPAEEAKPRTHHSVYSVETRGLERLPGLLRAVRGAERASRPHRVAPIGAGGADEPLGPGYTTLFVSLSGVHSASGD